MILYMLHLAHQLVICQSLLETSLFEGCLPLSSLVLHLFVSEGISEFSLESLRQNACTGVLC